MFEYWPPVGRTVWGGSGGMALEKVCHWDQMLRFQRLLQCPVFVHAPHSPSFTVVDQDVSSQLFLQSAIMDSKPLKPLAK